MKTKQTNYFLASVAILIFVILGYIVKFYPENLVGFDSVIQNGIRGNLASGITTFFKSVTTIGNTATQVVIALLIFAILYWKQYRAEAFFVASSAIIAGILIVSLKYIYQRPRPSITHLVEAHGFSFPSGHSTGTFLILGSLIIVLHQIMKAGALRTTLEILLGVIIFNVGVSRIYVGVHYPTDVIGGFTLAFGILNLIYPTYDRYRFEQRFQGKQK